MYCKICKEFITYRITWMNLFTEPSYEICDKCYQKYKISVAYDDIQMANYTFRWFHLFKQEYDVNYLFFMNELSRLFLLATKDNYGIIVFYEYFPNEKVLNILGQFGEMVTILTVFS